MAKMNYAHVILVALLLIFGALAWLVWLAAEGSPGALVTIGAIAAAILIALGAGLMLVSQKISSDRQQQLFRDNAIENQALTHSIQRTQNLQNKMLLDQARAATRMLPAPENEVFDVHDYIEPGIFTDLEDEEG